MSTGAEVADAMADYYKLLSNGWTDQTAHPALRPNGRLPLGRPDSYGQCEVIVPVLRDRLQGDFPDRKFRIAWGDVSTYLADGDAVWQWPLIRWHLWIKDDVPDGGSDDLWAHDPTSGQAECSILPPYLSGTYGDLAVGGAIAGLMADRYTPAGAGL